MSIDLSRRVLVPGVTEAICRNGARAKFAGMRQGFESDNIYCCGSGDYVFEISYTSGHLEAGFLYGIQADGSYTDFQEDAIDFMSIKAKRKLLVGDPVKVCGPIMAGLSFEEANGRIGVAELFHVSDMAVVLDLDSAMEDYYQLRSFSDFDEDDYTWSAHINNLKLVRE